MAPVKLRLLVVAGLLALASLVPLGMAASDQVAVMLDDRPDGPCSSHPLVPFTARETSAAWGGLLIHFKNEGDAAAGRLCLFDGAGVKRLDTEIAFGRGETRDVLLATAPGVYTYRAEFSHHSGFRNSGSSTVDTRWCLSGTEDTHHAFRIGPESSSSKVEGGDCVLPGTLTMGAGGLAAAGVTAFVGAFPHSGALLLYSRIVRPRVLDQSVRGRIHDLVAREPGIHAGELMRALDAGEGQTAYHLGVLAREKMLVSIGKPWTKHWFVNGRYSAGEMRALATLRDATRRRVYDAVVATPGISLRILAARVGVSVSQASRAARSLERAGLVDRRTDGRVLTLLPRAAATGGEGRTVAA